MSRQSSHRPGAKGLITGPVVSPTTLGAIWRWPERYIKALPDILRNALGRNIGTQPVYCTTAYSGIGMWETTLSYIIQPLVNDASTLRVVSATDVSEHCKRVLLHHEGPSKAMHCFSDLEERWAPVVLRQMHQALESAQEKLKKDRPKAGGGAVSGAEYDHVADALQATLQSCLRPEDRRSTCFCYVHRQQCPVYDYDLEQVRSEQGLILHLASPVCKDHSLQNRERLRACGPHSIVWAIWLRERILQADDHAEDIIMMENVPGHPSAKLLREALPAHEVVSFVIGPDQVFGDSVFKALPSQAHGRSV